MHKSINAKRHNKTVKNPYTKIRSCCRLSNSIGNAIGPFVKEKRRNSLLLGPDWSVTGRETNKMTD